MARNSVIVPEAKEAMNKFKMEAASEVGVNLKQGYNGDLTSRQAGSVGGQMVKKMIQQYAAIGSTPPKKLYFNVFSLITFPNIVKNYPSLGLLLKN